MKKKKKSDASRAPIRCTSSLKMVLTRSCGCGTGDSDGLGGQAVCHRRCDEAAWC
jgi:hypothetical protein